ncbi:unnamed protein product [Caenorhabditis auriculariae]|uniref:Uncharacterized protein n=1 Tax=Caenorhabditis auriculariae TaxID=2777116 RepID=A0A8S1GUB9_9PELO|nr:unnamed protein product [Caenorhabditis auriculariae]
MQCPNAQSGAGSIVSRAATRASRTESPTEGIVQWMMTKSVAVSRRSRKPPPVNWRRRSAAASPPSTIDSTYSAIPKFWPVGSPPSDGRQQAEPRGRRQTLLLHPHARSFSRTWSRKMRPGSSTTTTPPCRLDPARRRAADSAESRPAPAEDHALLLGGRQELLYFELLPQGRTVTASIYTNQLKKQAAAIREKRPRRASVHLLHNSAPLSPHGEGDPAEVGDARLWYGFASAVFLGPRSLRLPLVPPARAPFGRKKNSSTTTA